MSESFSPEAKEIIIHLLQHADNSYCADCGAFSPKWASTTLGVFICLNCSGIHRSLGTHITLVRSCTLDSWTMKQVRVMSRVGNRVAHEYWEAKMPPGYCRPKSDRYAMERFINDKYVRRMWAAEGPPPPYQTQPTERRHIKNIFGDLSLKEQNSPVHKSSSSNLFPSPSHHQVERPTMSAGSRYSVPNFNTPCQPRIPDVVSQPTLINNQQCSQDNSHKRFAKKAQNANKQVMPMIDFDVNSKAKKQYTQNQHQQPIYRQNNTHEAPPSILKDPPSPRRQNEKPKAEEKSNVLDATEFSLKLHSPFKRQAYEAPVTIQSPKHYFQIDFTQLSPKNRSPKAPNNHTNPAPAMQNNHVREKKTPSYLKTKNSNDNNSQNNQPINFSVSNNKAQSNVAPPVSNQNNSVYHPQNYPQVYQIPPQEVLPPVPPHVPQQAQQKYHGGGARDLYVQQRRMKRLAEQQAREAKEASEAA